MASQFKLHYIIKFLNQENKVFLSLRDLVQMLFLRFNNFRRPPKILVAFCLPLLQVSLSPIIALIPSIITLENQSLSQIALFVRMCLFVCLLWECVCESVCECVRVGVCGCAWVQAYVGVPICLFFCDWVCVGVWVWVGERMGVCLYICSFVFVLVFALMCLCTNLAEMKQREDAGVASFFRKSTLKIAI